MFKKNNVLIAGKEDIDNEPSAAHISSSQTVKIASESSDIATKWK